jgi:hypothetical protein
MDGLDLSFNRVLYLKVRVNRRVVFGDRFGGFATPIFAGGWACFYAIFYG